MSKEYDMTFQSRDEAIFGLDRLLVPKEQLKDRLEYLAIYKDPQFGQQWDFRHENNIHSLKDRHFLTYLAQTLDEDVVEQIHAETPSPAARDMDWGSERHGPPTSGHAN